MNDLAEGDLTTESTYEFQGDFIVVKDSMNKTIRNLGNALNKVNCSAAQVSLGSRQISDGAQSLAQGATEQAASIEQLSSSVSEISQKTKHNAEMAGKAALLSETIRGNAEKGSIHMAEMISAVGNISEASHSISKVIKVIDDIAFQTNILALNAAVEAVRAGQHGKGFAVVAGEVRHLAAKSAEAAKETEEMIQNSIEKADLGSQIAGEAAASLADIVSGINESSELVRGIAMSSEEQSLGIRQVNVGIEQVSQVIQQNSATAEESAAASEEMSSQSEILGELTAQFRLKDVNASHGSLISSSIY
jgi:methyl-accepting chemotaxis protein